MIVVTLFPRRKRRPSSLRRRPRRPNPDQVVNRVGLSELTPDLGAFLGQVAYLQLSFFEELSRAIMEAPSTSSKLAVSRVASIVLERHHALVAEIERIGSLPSEAMEPFVGPIDDFQARIRGGDWCEAILAYHVASGLLDDAFSAIAQGFDDDVATRIAELLSNDAAHDIVVAELRNGLDGNGRLDSRLALYGRRLVGDLLLLARSALKLPENTAPDDERLEPVVTELIAEHTRRMDDLGLTA